jgi:predicted RNA-binding Zn-ribbon protein involved in translation (DUF1610 family)
VSESLRCRSCGAWLEIGEKGGIVRCAYCGANNEAGAQRKVTVEYSHEFTRKLYRAIDENFTLEEMKELVLELQGKLPEPYRLDYDDISGSNQRSKARELVQWCERRRLLEELAEAVVHLRPAVDL